MKKATDKSVRDCPQQATLDGDKITITSRVGRAVTGIFSFTLAEWEWATTKSCANPHYGQAEFIRNRTIEMDDQPGGPCQAERIRDSMRYAVKKVLEP